MSLLSNLLRATHALPISVLAFPGDRLPSIPENWTHQMFKGRRSRGNVQATGPETYSHSEDNQFAQRGLNNGPAAQAGTQETFQSL